MPPENSMTRRQFSAALLGAGPLASIPIGAVTQEVKALTQALQ